MTRFFPLSFSFARSAWWLAALLALLAGGTRPVQAGGPEIVSSTGQPARWDMSQPVPYVVDAGPLGPLSHAQAVAMVKQAFQIWQSVPMARVQFAPAGELSTDITGRNVVAYLNGLRQTSPSPILFDSDGSITDTLEGRGASQFVFGFTASLANTRGQMVQAYTVLNGALPAPYSAAYRFGVAVHELGHLAGLDHSQINGEQQFAGNPAHDVLSPIMSYFRGPNDDGTLQLDDQMWLSWLYPSPDFAATTGAISGRVLLPDGVTGMRGIDVIARRVGDPLVTAVSSISGFLFGSASTNIADTGLHDPARLGDFMIPGLPPGSYTVEVRDLQPGAALRVPAGYLIGGQKFWHQGSSAQDDPNASSLIEVKAGQQVTGIDILLNGDSLGAPKPVTEQTPNTLPNAQRVTLPLVISGKVEDPAGDPAGHVLQSTDDLQRVYRVILREWTVVTAVLSAADRGADLDLVVLDKNEDVTAPEASSALNGTPPEVVQLRLPPGTHYFGVHLAGSRGSAYTLSLLASPAPGPDPAPEYDSISYLLVGDVTPTSAVAHWETTGDTPSVIYYNKPLQEIGSTQPERVHSLALPNLPPGSHTDVDVYAQSPGGVDELLAPLTTANAPAADGSPRIVAVSSHIPYGNGIEQVTVRLSNPGDGDALKVQIKQLIPATGWVLVPERYYGVRLPGTLDAGGIGAGGAGAFVVLLGHTGGTAAAKLTVHGTYTDANGTPGTF